MIISDFIAVRQADKNLQKNQFDQKLVESGITLKTQMAALQTVKTYNSNPEFLDMREWNLNRRELQPFDMRRDEIDTLNALNTKMHLKYDGLRANLLTKHGSLPPEFLDKTDNLTRLSQSPKVNLSEARRIADLLNFVIIPFAYLDERSYNRESHQTRIAIQEFNSEGVSKVVTQYVICPVQFYSLEKHIKSNLDLPVYASPNLVQSFMAISINIPMFRSMLHEMQSMRNDIRNMDDRIRGVEAQVKNLALQVNQLAQQVQMQMQQALIRESAMKAELAGLRASAFAMEEPMLLGIPQGQSVFGNEWAFVGPCWGPDFDDIVMAALSLSPVPQQRQQLEKHWGYNNSEGHPTAKQLQQRQNERNRQYTQGIERAKKKYR